MQLLACQRVGDELAPVLDHELVGACMQTEQELSELPPAWQSPIHVLLSLPAGTGDS